MKKSIFLVAFCLLGLSQISAQVTFKPGVRAGLNFSHFTKGDYNDYYYNSSYNNYYYDSYGNRISTNERLVFKSRTDFYVGLFGALKLSKVYTLQPEIDYSRQGSKTPDKKIDLQVSYLGLNIINKFNFKKVNIQIGPGLDFEVENNFDTEAPIDLTFMLGAGYDITNNISVEGRIKKGIVPVLDTSSSHTNVVFSVGAAYKFDIK